MERDVPAPLLRIERGAPDEAELAALVAVVAELVTRVAPPSAAVSQWAGPEWRPGPDAWRASGLPR